MRAVDKGFVKKDDQLIAADQSELRPPLAGASERSSLIMKMAHAWNVLLALAILWAGLNLSAAEANGSGSPIGAELTGFATDQKQVYLGWRLLGADPAALAFNVYRVHGRRAAGETERRTDCAFHRFRG
jgi:hypothetical protein